MRAPQARAWSIQHVRGVGHCGSHVDHMSRAMRLTFTLLLGRLVGGEYDALVLFAPFLVKLGDDLRNRNGMLLAILVCCVRMIELADYRIPR